MKCVTSFCLNKPAVKCWEGETAIAQYFGYCSDCWTKITPERRSILADKEPQQVIERVRVIYPASSRMWRAAKAVWHLAIASFMGWATWRLRR